MRDVWWPNYYKSCLGQSGRWCSFLVLARRIQRSTLEEMSWLRCWGRWMLAPWRQRLWISHQRGGRKIPRLGWQMGRRRRTSALCRLVVRNQHLHLN